MRKEKMETRADAGRGQQSRTERRREDKGREESKLPRTKFPTLSRKGSGCGAATFSKYKLRLSTNSKNENHSHSTCFLTRISLWGPSCFGLNFDWHGDRPGSDIDDSRLNVLGGWHVSNFWSTESPHVQSHSGRETKTSMKQMIGKTLREDREPKQLACTCAPVMHQLGHHCFRHGAALQKRHTPGTFDLERSDTAATIRR